MARIYKILGCTYLILFFCLPQAAVAQSTASPFDLIPRIKGVEEDSTIAITNSSNPFDIKKTRPINRPSRKTEGFIIEQTAKPLTLKEKVSHYRRFLFITILVMLIMLTLIVTIFRILIEKVWKAFINDNLLNQLLREQGTGITLAYLILYSMFFVNAGIFTFLVAKQFNIEPAPTNTGGLFLCIGGILAFFLLKHAMLKVVGFTFPVQKEVAAYNFTIIVFNIIVGFFLVPAVLFAAYAPPTTIKYVIYGTVGLLSATYLFMSLRGLFIANRFIAWHKFHFLLYLCAVEIAPLLIVTKLLLNQEGG
ncbi:MAG: DUF4271 domain-containing protein [Lewinellaceae bacterium]|nr:DUF4271 domain-containing protein [Saprospiraceae bacterium]MCB9338191.1 DUF4271 domain-containing protein [Lewinellaceae bacterium]